MESLEERWRGGWTDRLVVSAARALQTEAASSSLWTDDSATALLPALMDMCGSAAGSDSAAEEASLAVGEGQLGPVSVARLSDVANGLQARDAGDRDRDRDRIVIWLLDTPLELATNGIATAFAALILTELQKPNVRLVVLAGVLSSEMVSFLGNVAAPLTPLGGSPVVGAWTTALASRIGIQSESIEVKSLELPCWSPLWNPRVGLIPSTCSAASRLWKPRSKSKSANEGSSAFVAARVNSLLTGLGFSSAELSLVGPLATEAAKLLSAWPALSSTSSSRGGAARVVLVDRVVDLGALCAHSENALDRLLESCAGEVKSETTSNAMDVCIPSLHHRPLLELMAGSRRDADVLGVLQRSLLEAGDFSEDASAAAALTATGGAIGRLRALYGATEVSRFDRVFRAPEGCGGCVLGVSDVAGRVCDVLAPGASAVSWRLASTMERAVLLEVSGVGPKPSPTEDSDGSLAAAWANKGKAAAESAVELFERFASDERVLSRDVVRSFFSLVAMVGFSRGLMVAGPGASSRRTRLSAAVGRVLTNLALDSGTGEANPFAMYESLVRSMEELRARAGLDSVARMDLATGAAATDVIGSCLARVVQLALSASSKGAGADGLVAGGTWPKGSVPSSAQLPVLVIVLGPLGPLELRQALPHLSAHGGARLFGFGLFDGDALLPHE